MEQQMEGQMEGYCQMTARVNRDGTLMCEHICSFGNPETAFDMATYDKAIMTAARHPDLFSASQVNGQVY